MRIGAALVLIAVGAILRFAIAVSSTHGFNLQVIGDILMAVGIVGLLLWIAVWAPWARGSRNTTYQQPPPADPRRYPRDGYPSGSYAPDDRTYEDYPR